MPSPDPKNPVSSDPQVAFEKPALEPHALNTPLHPTRSGKTGNLDRECSSFVDKLIGDLTYSSIEKRGWDKLLAFRAAAVHTCLRLITNLPVKSSDAAEIRFARMMQKIIFSDRAPLAYRATEFGIGLASDESHFAESESLYRLVDAAFPLAVQVERRDLVTNDQLSYMQLLRESARQGAVQFLFDEHFEIAKTVQRKASEISDIFLTACPQEVPNGTHLGLAMVQLIVAMTQGEGRLQGKLGVVKTARDSHLFHYCQTVFILSLVAEIQKRVLDKTSFPLSEVHAVFESFLANHDRARALSRNEKSVVSIEAKVLCDIPVQMMVQQTSHAQLNEIERPRLEAAACAAMPRLAAISDSLPQTSPGRQGNYDGRFILHYPKATQELDLYVGIDTVEGLQFVGISPPRAKPASLSRLSPISIFGAGDSDDISLKNGIVIFTTDQDRAFYGPFQRMLQASPPETETKLPAAIASVLQHATSHLRRLSELYPSLFPGARWYGPVILSLSKDSATMIVQHNAYEVIPRSGLSVPRERPEFPNGLAMGTGDWACAKLDLCFPAPQPLAPVFSKTISVSERLVRLQPSFFNIACALRDLRWPVVYDAAKDSLRIIAPTRSGPKVPLLMEIPRSLRDSPLPEEALLKFGDLAGFDAEQFVAILESRTLAGTRPLVQSEVAHDFIEMLPTRANAAVLQRLTSIMKGNLGDFKWIQGHQFLEARMALRPALRLYIAPHDSHVLLLAAGTKDTQLRDIQTAEKVYGQMKGKFSDS